MLDIMRLHGIGFQHEHPRVRYQALMSLGRLLNYCCPELQYGYDEELMPLFMKWMAEEEQVKMKSQVVACTVSFVTNLTGSSQSEEEISPEAKEKGK